MLNKENLNTFFTNMTRLKCLVIGDVMIDSYRWGKVNRVSPEAPVPIIELTKREDRLGGAANVALNLKSLGAQVSLASIIGDDNAGKTFYQLLEKRGIDATCVISDNTRKTTIKTRVIGGSQHLLRIDDESLENINKGQQDLLIKKIKDHVLSKKIDVVIFEDYDKGLLTTELIGELSDFFNQNEVPVLVDPKKNQFWDYKKIDLFKPNLKELVEGLKTSIPENDEDLKKLVQSFLAQQQHRSILLTLSEKGVMYCDKEQCFIIPAFKRDIADVSGAGDTVIAVAAVALAGKLNAKDIALLSNLAGGIVCEKVGVVAISPEVLKQETEKVLSSSHELSII